MVNLTRAFYAVALALIQAQVWGQIPHDAERYKRQYVRIIRAEWGLDAPIASFAAQVHQESSWNCNAVSRVGARSCTQFMPTTANWIQEVRPDLKSDELYSPAWAFRAQAVYMRWLHDRVKGPAPCERMAFALQAYNSGLGWVYRRQKLSPDPRRCFGVTCTINPGVLPANQREAEDYPVRILLRLEPRYKAWGPGSC